MFKLLVVVALCAFAFAQCMPSEKSAAHHERMRRQMPMPGDLMNIPMKAGADMAHTFTGLGEKVMNSGGGPGGMGGEMGGMGQMGK